MDSIDYRGQSVERRHEASKESREGEEGVCRVSKVEKWQLGLLKVGRDFQSNAKQGGQRDGGESPARCMRMRSLRGPGSRGKWLEQYLQDDSSNLSCVVGSMHLGIVWIFNLGPAPLLHSAGAACPGTWKFTFYTENSSTFGGRREIYTVNP